MSDKTTKTFSTSQAPSALPAAALLRLSVWLPFALLALSAAAFGFGAPAAIARNVHRSPSSLGFQAESAMRDEPVMFPMPGRHGFHKS